MAELTGQDICTFKSPNPRRLLDMAIQVWLLASDGTALAQSRKPEYVSAGNGGCKTNPAQFWIRATASDPMAIAINIEGEMFIRKIPAHSISQ